MADLRVTMTAGGMRLEPQGASLLAPYVAAAAASADRAAGAGAAQPDPSILVPGRYYLVEGEKLSLFCGGLTTYRETSVYDFAAVSDLDVHWNAGRRVVLDPTIHRGAGAIVAMRRNADVQDNWRRDVRFVVSPAAPANATIRHLAIGDSLTWRGWVTRLKALFAGSSITYQPIGSFADIAGTPSEGRSSWSPQTYTGVRPGVNVDGTPVIKPVTDVAAYLAMSPTPYATGGRWDYNPFWRPAVNGDDPAKVHGGYVFDVRFYLNRFSFADPTVVTIALGTNPTLQGRPLAETMASIAEMVAEVRRALPNAGIGLCMNGLVEVTAWGIQSTLIAEILRVYSGREAENIAVLPWWQASDPKIGYDVNVLTPANAIGAYRAGGGDCVHPIDQGVVHRQWAQMVRGWMLARLAGA